MHRILSVEEDFADHSFCLLNVYNGDRFRVTIDDDKRELFNDRSIFEEWPEACTFLRKDPARGRVCCTVHHTRPDLCREFGCWRILILDSTGHRVGRIMGTRHLSTEENNLRQLWEYHSREFQALDDTAWDDAVVRFFQNAGYRVFR